MVVVTAAGVVVGGVFVVVGVFVFVGSAVSAEAMILCLRNSCS